MNMMEDLDYLIMEVSFKLINNGLTVATPSVVEMSISDADFRKISDLSVFFFHPFRLSFQTNNLTKL